MRFPWFLSDRHKHMSASTRRRRYPVPRRRAAYGFTLIEVMVVLGLTLVMMALFATIFSLTGTFVTKQKGVGENDQSARILTTVMKTDLEARTMRSVAPFHPNMTTASLAAFAASQQGYFYVSENDPSDDTDDVLQFTINMGGTGLSALKNPAAGNQLYGSALFLALPWQKNTSYPAGALVRPSTPTANTAGLIFKNKTGAAFTSGGTEPTWPTTLTTIADAAGTWTALTSPIDQPDGDDGVIAYDALTPADRTLDPAGSNPNNTGASQFAEVTYFLRNGNLYRRVDLIRQPYDNSSAPVAGSSQPYDTDTPTPAFMIPGAYPPYVAGTGSGNFWTDFDYSARLVATTWQASTAYVAGQIVLSSPANGHAYSCTAAGTSGGAQPAFPTTPGATVTDNGVTWTTDAAPAVNFLGTGALENSLSNLLPAGTLPIARPDNRFGFDQTYNTTAAPPVANGAPREFAFSYNSGTNAVTGTSPALMFYFGRYTQEETSNSLFQFPGNLPVINGLNFLPMGSGSLLGLDSSNFTMWFLDTVPTPTVGVTKSVAGGPRRGEDILLTNVVSFDVKLWDPHYSETVGSGDVNRNGLLDPGPAFADIGHAAASGDFLATKNIFPVYGPRIDTGYAAPASPWAAGTPAFTRPPVAGVTYNFNNVFDTWYPQFNFDNFPRTYGTAPSDTAVPYAPAPYRPTLGATWSSTATYAVGNQVNSGDLANGYVYQCTAVTTGLPGPTEPFTLGDTVGGTITDGGVTWTVMPPLGVKAVQITVKYLDPTQNLLRQVTIVQSLTP
jgi:hypothetical protein